MSLNLAFAMIRRCWKRGGALCVCVCVRVRVRVYQRALPKLTGSHLDCRHLQKNLLNRGYSNIQVVAWYYSYGVAMLALMVLPNALDAAMWHFQTADFEAMGYGLALWYVCCSRMLHRTRRPAPCPRCPPEKLRAAKSSVLRAALLHVAPRKQQFA